MFIAFRPFVFDNTYKWYAFYDSFCPPGLWTLDMGQKPGNSQ